VLTREIFFNTRRKISNLQSNMQFSFYYIKFLIHNDVFGDFPKISDNFPKIFEDFPKCVRRPDERFRTFTKHFRRCPKISEDNRKLPTTSVEDPKMFRSLSNKFRYRKEKKMLSRMVWSHLWIKMIYYIHTKSYSVFFIRLDALLRVPRQSLY